MRMITVCFARVSLRCTRRTYMPFLLIMQGIRPSSKTRNQLMDRYYACPLVPSADRCW